MPQNAHRSHPKSDETVDAYIDRLDVKRAAIVGALRAVVAAAAPDAMERIARGRVVYSRGKPTVCHISAHQKHVSIGFPRGVQLRDPRGVLSGTGKGMRHVKCTALLELPTEAIRDMVEQAWGFEGV